MKKSSERPNPPKKVTLYKSPFWDLDQASSHREANAEAQVQEGIKARAEERVTDGYLCLPPWR